MMDLSQQLRALASDVGNDYAMSAPEDAASLIGKARRGRIVWTSGVGAVAAAGAATLVFGAPAVAAVMSSGDAQLEPAGPASETTNSMSDDSMSDDSMSDDSMTDDSMSESPDASETPVPAGVIDLSGGVSGSGDDDSYDDSSDDSYDDSSDDSYESAETHSEDPAETHSEDSEDD